METQGAIMAFSQSEKIKSVLIWLSQALELLRGLPEQEKKGAERMIKTFVDMVFHEISLAGKVTGEESWKDIERHVDQAAVMINSGVGADAVVNLTRALSQVTSIGQRSMSYLKENGLL